MDSPLSDCHLVYERHGGPAAGRKLEILSQERHSNGTGNILGLRGYSSLLICRACFDDYS